MTTNSGAAGINLTRAITGATIANTDSGSITVISNGGTNAFAWGINFDGAVTASSTINNAGLIDVQTSGEGHGIRLSYSYSLDNSSIDNSGTINVTGSGTDSVNGISIVDASGTSSITNSFMIDVESQGGAKGIKAQNLLDTSSIVNSGTISATSNNDEAVGIYVTQLKDSSSIVNSGAIETTSLNDFAGGIVVDQGIYSNNATVTNSGTITVDGATGSIGIFAGGAYSYISNSTYTPTMTNSGTITATINGQADANGFAMVVNGGTVNNTYTDSTHYGKLYGNLFIDGTLNNDGLVSLPHNAIAEVANFVNSATGVLEIGLLTDGTNTTNSQLQTGTATFMDGSTIKVNVLAASTNVALLDGTTLRNVVTATNSLNIPGRLFVRDNSALLDFGYGMGWDNDNGVYYISLDAHAVGGSDSNIINSTVAGGGNTNTQSAAGALQTIQVEGIPSTMTGYFSALNHLGSDAEVAHAVASTTPIAANASVTANTQIMNGVQGIVEMRQNSVMGGSMNSGDMSLSDKNLWVKLYGSKGTQDNKDGINGFDVKAYGLGFGADAEISPRQRIGAAFFYTDAKVDVNDMPQSSKLKVYTAMLYGNVPMNTNTDFLYQAGYTWQKTESERTVLPTYDHAKADYTATTASLDLKVMQTYKMNEAMDVRPLIEGTYRYFTNPSYSESGAGAMNLQTDKFTSSQLITSAGAIIDYKLDKTSKLVTDLRLGYDWHHDSQAVSASYEGASGVSFTTRGIDNGGWQYDIGLGYETTKILGGEVNFMYNYQGQGSSFDNHVLSAKYVYKF